jgi:hypothetical protein
MSQVIDLRRFNGVDRTSTPSATSPGVWHHYACGRRYSVEIVARPRLNRYGTRSSKVTKIIDNLVLREYQGKTVTRGDIVKLLTKHGFSEKLSRRYSIRTNLLMLVGKSRKTHFFKVGQWQ